MNTMQVERRIRKRKIAEEISMFLAPSRFEPRGKSEGEIQLSAGGKRLLDTPNAGGSSVWSEVISFEVLHAQFNADLSHTEMEIQYCCHSKITDYSIKIFGRSIGVSVTRAMKYGFGQFDDDDAVRLLTKKLEGCQESSRNVLEQFSWDKQILHILVEQQYMVDVLLRAYQNLIPPSCKDDTIILLTVSPLAPWLFYDPLKKPKLRRNRTRKTNAEA